MTPIEQILSQSIAGKRELKRQDLIVSVTEQIWAALEAAKMSKADLARTLETSKSNVTQLLSGDRNMTLATLSDIASALGLNPCIYLAEAAHQSTSIHQRVFDVIQYVEKSKQTITLTHPAKPIAYQNYALAGARTAGTALSVAM